jgi:hypothetical protein
MADFLQRKANAIAQPGRELMAIIQAYSELDGLVSLPVLQSNSAILTVFSGLFSDKGHDKDRWLKFIEVLSTASPDYAAVIIRFVPGSYCEDALEFMRELAKKADGEATASLRESRLAIELVLYSLKR